MADDARHQYLTFLLGEEVFALDIRSVREIIQQGQMTPVPLMPNFVRGVINLRGAVFVTARTYICPAGENSTSSFTPSPSRSM